MKLRLIVLLAAASLAATPALASHGNPKDFYAVQKHAQKKAVDADTTGTAPHKCTGGACKQR